MSSTSDSEPPTETLDSPKGRAPRLRLLAIWDDEHLSFPLPESGTLTVGRAEGVEVQIPDPAMSRHHVKFHLEERVQVEDLSSANGTIVRGRALSPGETVEVSPGDMIELGRTMLFIQRTSPRARPVQIYAHDYFEARVDYECASTGRGSVGFAVVRSQGSGSTAKLLEERLAASLRLGDVLASYGPSEHEMLWVGCTLKTAERRATALQTSLRGASASASVGVAFCPRDGRTAAALLARANAAVRGVAWGETAAPMVFQNGPMENLGRQVEAVAKTNMSVLITGETGVGKGLLAAELHRKSPRASGPFVAINCAELTESLVDAELFGHEKAIFTGAVKKKIGLIESADGGTLLLDEIGEMSPATQAKMLRVLEDGQVRPVGALRPRHVDVRVVACTNRDLEDEMERGTFRTDLYYRLAQFELFVPPLRERPEEIEGLAQRFAAEAPSAKALGSVPVLSPEARVALRNRAWSGNVRELRNAIERAVLLCGDGVIRPEHLPVERVQKTIYAQPSQGLVTPLPPASERQRILNALAENGGNQKRAAQQLGISLRTLVNRLAKFDVPRPRKKRT